MCLNPSPTCHFMTPKSLPNERCSNCPGLTEIRELLKTIFVENQITAVHINIQIGTDCFTVASQVLPSDDFVDSLCTVPDILKPHAYIVDRQGKYFKSLKDNIVEGDLIVQCNSDENHSLVEQNAPLPLEQRPGKYMDIGLLLSIITRYKIRKYCNNIG